LKTYTDQQKFRTVIGERNLNPSNRAYRQDFGFRGQGGDDWSDKESVTRLKWLI